MSGPAAPTDKQHDALLVLASGAAGLAWKARLTEQLLRRGWVTAERKEDNRSRYYHMVRITPDGLRALALGVERRGLPEIGPKSETTIRVCLDCGSTKYRHKKIPVEEVTGACA